MTTDAVNEVRSRIDLVDLIGAHVRLVRAGRSFKGLCPFHNEKTPSFNVNPERRIWHCFGCGEHGDCFTFVMKLEGLTFPEALKRLAEKVGVEVQVSRPGPSRGEREEMLQALSAAARFFRTSLDSNPQAISYLAKRQIDPEAAARFGIGYAPASWDALSGFLAREKVNTAAAAKAGLVGARRDGSYYDRFRNRLMFPVTDAGDQIVGFGGRDMGEEGPKYLNSPETPVFHKASILYGWPLARRAIAEKGVAIVMEGYLDVISAHRAGLSNTVASMGTAFGEGHCRLLKLGADRVVVCFDSDTAGRKAALSAGETLETAGFDVRVAVLPPGEDPDSLVTSGNAPLLMRAVEEAVPASEHRLQMMMARFRLDDSADRARMLSEAVRLLARTPNVFERDRLIRRLAVYHPSFSRSSDAAEARIRSEVDRAAGGSQAVPGRTARRPPPAAQRSDSRQLREGALQKAEQVLLRSLLDGDAFADHIANSIPADRFVSQAARDLAAEIYTRRQLGEDPATLALETEGEDEPVSRLACSLMVRTDLPPVTQEVVDDCIGRVLRESRRERLARLQEKFSRGELKGGDPELRELLSLQREKQP